METWRGGGADDPGDASRPAALEAVVHDINNLLFPILNAAEELARKLPEGEARELAELILNAAVQAAELARSARSPERRVELVDVNDAILNLRPVLEHLVGPGVGLVLRCEASRARIEADEVDVVRVLINLATNARDAVEKGGRVTLATCDNEGDGLRIIVADTGIGMTDAVCQQALDRSYTTKVGDRHQGLGLSTTVDLIRSMGGEVLLRSQPGVGTTVELHVPHAMEGRTEARG